MAPPQMVSRDAWLGERTAPLAEEKALASRRDALKASRRRLAMVRNYTECRFAGSYGEVGLLDLYAGRHQRMVTQFVFDSNLGRGSPGLHRRVRRATQTRRQGVSFPHGKASSNEHRNTVRAWEVLTETP